MKTIKKCRYADKYLGIKAPTCGCEHCNRIWKLKQKLTGENKMNARTPNVDLPTITIPTIKQ